MTRVRIRYATDAHKRTRFNSNTRMYTYVRPRNTLLIRFSESRGTRQSVERTFDVIIIIVIITLYREETDEQHVHRAGAAARFCLHIQSRSYKALLCPCVGRFIVYRIRVLCSSCVSFLQQSWATLHTPFLVRDRIQP